MHRYIPWWWNNFVSTPNRWMAYWLRRRGWVCFYLDERARNCGQQNTDCWLRLYQEGEKRAVRRDSVMVCDCSKVEE